MPPLAGQIIRLVKQVFAIVGQKGAAYFYPIIRLYERQTSYRTCYCNDPF